MEEQLDIETITCVDVKELNTLYNTNNSSELKLFHLNIRSLRKNFDEILVLLNELKFKFDVIIFTETHINYDVTNQFQIPEYQAYSFNCKNSKADGIIIYVHREQQCKLRCEPIEEISHANAVKITLEPSRNNTIEILAIYRSPCMNGNIFVNELDQCLQTMKAKHKLIIGDININIIENTNASHNSCQESYKEIMASNGFISCINAPTRTTAETATCIDHIYLNSKNDSNVIPIILETAITDHFAIALSWGYNTCNSKNCKLADEILYRDIVDSEHFVNVISELNWDRILTDSSVNPEIAWDEFEKYIGQAMKSSTKTICTKPNARTRKIKPWITSGLITSIRKRDAMSRDIKRDSKYRELHNLPPNTEFQKRFKMYRNYLTSLLDKTKNDFYKEQILKVQNEPKKVWKIINEITGSKTKTPNLQRINEIKVNNKIINTPKEIANCFVNYFTDIGCQLANNIRQKTHVQTNSNIRRIEDAMRIEDITEKEILQHISELRDNAASGIDGISSKLIKKIKEYIIFPISQIFNACLHRGVFPHSLKVAIIKPIFKAKDIKNCENYRPISLIKNFAKIFEKCLKSRLINFLEKHQVLSNSQFGFREGRSTQDAIHSLTSIISENLDRSRKTLAVFLDLAKAFDTVDHTILLGKLECYGIRGVMNEMFKQYLSNRTQYVKIRNEMSDPRTIEFGVPQGTILGPVLFLVYINDIFDSEVCGTLISFADDTAILFHSDTVESLIEKTETGIKIVHNWLNSNLLTLNLDKTVFIPFSCYENQNYKQIEIKIHSQTCKPTPNLNQRNQKCLCYTIKNVEDTKYLGVQIDSHINWKKHIGNTVSKLRNLSYTFYRLRSVLNLRNLRIVYFALVQSAISYAILAWGGASKSHVEKLNTGQNSIIKTMHKLPRQFSTSLLYQETKLSNVQQLFLKSLLIYTYKTNLGNQNHQSYLETRSQKFNKIKVPTKYTTLGQRQADYLGPTIYNQLPKHIRDLTPFNKFKITVKKWIYEYNIKIIET
jgi:hypothetical protein